MPNTPNNTAASRAVTGARRHPATVWGSACLALLMGVSAVGVQAQPRDHRPDSRPEQRHDARPAHGAPAGQMQQHRPGPPPHAQGPRRGAGPDHRWHKGDRVPPVYRTRHYVVNDWRAHRLAPPPRGYHWVQHGGDYLLVAIATGVIAQLILSQ